MNFNSDLVKGTLLKRYKRFLADIRLDNGQMITAHTPNTGSMTGCTNPGAAVWVIDSGNPKRKYPYSWELVEIAPGILVGINTILANNLILEGIQSGVIKELQGYNKIRTEVSYGKENSRIDILLEADSSTECYIEVKNVTLVENEIAYFPDAVSKRGSKHLRELEGVVKKGKRGVIVYCVQRKDAKAVSPADHIDTEYGITLRNAVAAGVEAIAYQADITLKNIVISNSLPVKYY